MSEHVKKLPARPMIRKVALVTSMACFLVAGIFVVFNPGGEGNWVGIVAGLVVGFVLLSIGNTGYWPPAKHKH